MPNERLVSHLFLYRGRFRVRAMLKFPLSVDSQRLASFTVIGVTC